VQPPRKPQKAKWYRSPWLWAAVGAVAATAVILPFTIDGGGAQGTATVRPGGFTW
jgi:hypothetical protein